ncbi:MAG: helix-turn-helix transcriptional regulator [Nitrospirae bacterium]|nr:helix-turn-helix transcriptional regulator [Nitrospirota bacterium]
MEGLTNQLGKRVKHIRKALKLTQGKIAEKTGLSVEYISRIERGVGQPSFRTLESLANVLHVDVKDFFDFKAHIIFKDKKQIAKQKKEYLEAISSELRSMEIHELAVIYNVIKGLVSR